MQHLTAVSAGRNKTRCFGVGSSYRKVKRGDFYVVCRYGGAKCRSLGTKQRAVGKEDIIAIVFAVFGSGNDTCSWVAFFVEGMGCALSRFF